MKKQLLFIAFMFLFVCHMCSCNDDGTGEGRDPKAKVLIDNETKARSNRNMAIGLPLLGGYVLLVFAMRKKIDKKW